MLNIALQNPDLQPNLLVRISGWAISNEELRTATGKSPHEPASALKCPVLMIQGEKDPGVPLPNIEQFAQDLRLNGVEVDLKVRKGKGHGLEEDSGIVLRGIGEYCQTHFSPGKPLVFLREEPSDAKPFWTCMMPSFVWLAVWFCLRRRLTQNGKQCAPAWWAGRNMPQKDKRLGAAALLLASWAVVLTAIHLLAPHLPVSGTTLAIARMRLISPKWREDFDELASKPYWKGHKLQSLLTHVELAHYNCFELINWQIDKEIYTNYVLSPIIDAETDIELNWRRALWEYCYPRVRKQDTPETTAEIVVRELRGRISIDPRFDYPTGIESVWDHLVASPKGFERIYIAALRSVGVGARLDAHGSAEIWTGRDWTPAPRPE